jgi:tRNA(Ile)-lysidine synthase
VTGPDLPTEVGAFLRAWLPAQGAAHGLAHLCVGYSGGLDSTVLLHVLAGQRQGLGFTLSALHVHHGLMPEADAWAVHCAKVCAAWAVPLTVERMAVQTADKGVEAAARDARRAAFARQPVEAIVLAQHQGDQAETLLFRLLRGAGTRGLSAMRPVVIVAGSPPLWRPLLTTPRAELLRYAESHSLSWIEDPSNADPVYSRNFLRNAVLPLLAQRFPAVTTILARTAEQLAEDAALLDELAALDMQVALDAEGRLCTAHLAALSAPRARNVLRHWLAQAGLHIDRARLEDLLRQALAAPDAHPLIQIKGCTITRHAGILALSLHHAEG